jgi:hypothetical protein
MERDELKALADEIENLVFQYAEKQMEPPIPGDLMKPLTPTRFITLASVENSEKTLRKTIKWARRAVNAEAKRMEIMRGLGND